MPYGRFETRADTSQSERPQKSKGRSVALYKLCRQDAKNADSDSTFSLNLRPLPSDSSVFANSRGQKARAILEPTQSARRRSDAVYGENRPGPGAQMPYTSKSDAAPTQLPYTKRPTSHFDAHSLPPGNCTRKEPGNDIKKLLTRGHPEQGLIEKRKNKKQANSGGRHLLR